MAIIKCDECGGKVSTYAKVCPHCGNDTSDCTCGDCVYLYIDVAECKYCSKNSDSVACPGLHMYESDDEIDPDKIDLEEEEPEEEEPETAQEKK